MRCYSVTPPPPAYVQTPEPCCLTFNGSQLMAIYGREEKTPTRQFSTTSNRPIWNVDSGDIVGHSRGRRGWQGGLEHQATAATNISARRWCRCINDNEYSCVWFRTGRRGPSNNENRALILLEMKIERLIGGALADMKGVYNLFKIVKHS